MTIHEVDLDPADLDKYVRTRAALHAIAEHVMSPARYAAVGRIGLRSLDGGFGTPYFGDDRRIRVAGDQILDEQYGEARAVPLTTLRAAAEFVGVAPGAPAGVYTPTTALDLDRPLEVHPDEAARLAAWYALGAATLAEWRDQHAATAPSLVQLWPEHFDLACDLGDMDTGRRANYGFSPGDTAIAEPYAYVGPWEIASHPHDLWDRPWGASLRAGDLGDDPAGQLLDFFTAGARALGGA
jgi:hypothetical protein